MGAFGTEMRLCCSRGRGRAHDGAVLAEGGGDADKGKEDGEHERERKTDLFLSKGKRPTALRRAHDPPPHAD